MSGDSIEALTLDELYISEKEGSDELGNGSEKLPFKTSAQAIKVIQKEPFPTIYVDSKTETQRWEKASQSMLKKMKKVWVSKKHKAAGKEDKELEDAEKRKLNLEDAKNIKIELDPSLPQPKKIEIYESYSLIDQRVQIFAWVHRLRRQGKNLIFITARDGTGHLQCVLADNLCKTYDALIMNTEASVYFYGKITKVPEGKEAPGGVELYADYFELIGNAPPGGVDSILNEDAGVEKQLDQRHMMLRGETLTKIVEVRSTLVQCFRDHYFSRRYKEVTPPTLVQSQVEGGSTLFKFDFFGQEAYLTQSSQLYLEALLPSQGKVFCVAQSYRAEQSRTRRHLAEYTHIEAEFPGVTYEDLLNRLEDLVIDVVDRILKSPVGKLVYEFNPDFKPPTKPLMRMDYSDAIKYLKDNNITKEDGTFYEFGEDIPEMPERKMTDKINQIIMLCRFPAGIKSFYMSKCEGSDVLTESVDILVPGVGEIVGGSMRIWHHDELMKGFENAGIDPKNYYWYTDQRIYGSCPHGGYGLGLERFLTWILKRHHIRDCCLFPRFTERCTP